MTEQEYIDATNLARIRAIKAIAAQMPDHPDSILPESHLGDLMRAIWLIEDRLTRHVKTKG